MLRRNRFFSSNFLLNLSFFYFRFFSFFFLPFQVLVAGSEGFSKNLTVAAKRALVSLGAGNDEVTTLSERNVFVMIGRKGAKPGSVPQV